MFKIVCYGDSHGVYFRDVFPQLATVDCQVIPGATITGLGKRKSTLETNKKILAEASTLPPDDFIALKFGQVDINTGFYYRLIAKEEMIEFATFSAYLIEAYTKFLLKLKTIHHNIIVCGINLPTLFEQDQANYHTTQVITEHINDQSLRSNLAKEYGRKLYSVLPSIADRTEMSIQFNKCLAALCQRHNIKYFDLVAEVLDPNTGLARPRFRSFWANHHYPLTQEIVELFTFKLIMTAKGLA